jgi:hypothetical protein
MGRKREAMKKALGHLREILKCDALTTGGFYHDLSEAIDALRPFVDPQPTTMDQPIRGRNSLRVSLETPANTIATFDINGPCPKCKGTLKMVLGIERVIDDPTLVWQCMCCHFCATVKANE